jgi:hypothetical protein
VTDRPHQPPTTHQLTTVVLGDRPEAWRAAGFEVSGAGTLTLGTTTVLLDGSGGGFVSWRLDGIDADLDGLPTTPADADPGPAEHPNGIGRIDHVVVRTGDCGRTIAACEAAGLEVRGGRSTTSYGAPMRQTFFWVGDVILELVGPDAGEPTTDEPTSIFGLALVADDLDATGHALGDLLGTPKDAVQAGRRIAGLRGKEVGIGLPLAVMSPHPGS